MRVRGSRVGIIGGSIAGCAGAIALRRLGCDVTVFERSSGGLRDRGAGIALPGALREELIQHDYLDVGSPCWPERDSTGRLASAGSRVWIVADGSPSGRVLWRQPSGGAVACNSWNGLWQGLRDRVPDSSYRDRSSVVALAQDDDGVELTLEDGSTAAFDVVVGADGYRSVVRQIVEPDSTPRPAGYVLWRGCFPDGDLQDRRAWDRVLATCSTPVVVFEGGHAIVYPIPDGGKPGSWRVNWGIYAPAPAGLGLDGRSSIVPGAVPLGAFAELARLRELVIPADLQPLWSGAPDDVSIQPIHDMAVGSAVSGRLLLIGDAATLTRPHTGSGATKALGDARCLETLGASKAEWPSLLVAYDAERTKVGRSLVELGRRLGRDQVEETPPWAKMTEPDFEAWIAGSLDRDRLYLYGSSGRDVASSRWHEAAE